MSDSLGFKVYPRKCLSNTCLVISPCRRAQSDSEDDWPLLGWTSLHLIELVYTSYANRPWDPPHCWPVMLQDQGSHSRKLTAGSTRCLASRLLSLLSKSPHVDNHSSTTDRSPGKTQERRTGLWTPEMLMVLWEPRSSVGAQVYNKYSADRYWRQCHETGKHTTFYEIKSENGCVSVIYSCVQSTPTLVA